MLKEKAFANAMALVIAVIYVICRALAGVAPDFLRSLAQVWFHSYDLSSLPAATLNFGGFLGGLITITILSWLFGYFLAWTYNKMKK